MLDELSSCAKAVQAAAYKIILDRMVGQHKLHPKVRILAAGNLETDNAHVLKMSTALGSRMIHFQLKVDHGEWMNWAEDNEVLTSITSFLEFQKRALHLFDPKKVENTFPCPRTWEMLSRVLEGETDMRKNAPLINGTIGEGMGTEFRTFCENFNKIPKLATILGAPETTTVPDETGLCYALSGMLSDALDVSNADALMPYICRLPVEMQVLCIRRAYRTKKTILSNNKVDAWLDKNAKIFVG